MENDGQIEDVSSNQTGLGSGFEEKDEERGTYGFCCRLCNKVDGMNGREVFGDIH